LLFLLKNFCGATDLSRLNSDAAHVFLLINLIFPFNLFFRRFPPLRPYDVLIGAVPCYSVFEKKMDLSHFP